MSKQHINTHIIRHALELIDKMPPLKEPKDPIVAAAAGFALGGLGTGLYFQSWRDFWIPWVALLVLGVVAIPTGEALLVLAPVLWAVYAHRRARSSNEKLLGQSRAGRGGIVEAELVVDPPPNSPRQTSGFSQAGVHNRLQRLDDLLDQGMLTPQEHAAKRRQILAEI